MFEIGGEDIDATIRLVHPGPFGVRSRGDRHSQTDVRPAARRKGPVLVFVRRAKDDAAPLRRHVRPVRNRTVSHRRGEWTRDATTGAVLKRGLRGVSHPPNKNAGRQ